MTAQWYNIYLPVLNLKKVAKNDLRTLMAKKKLQGKDGLDDGTSKFIEDTESELGGTEDGLLDEEESKDDNSNDESSDEEY